MRNYGFADLILSNKLCNRTSDLNIPNSYVFSTFNPSVMYFVVNPLQVQLFLNTGLILGPIHPSSPFKF